MKIILMLFLLMGSKNLFANEMKLCVAFSKTELITIENPDAKEIVKACECAKNNFNEEVRNPIGIDGELHKVFKLEILKCMRDYFFYSDNFSKSSLDRYKRLNKKGYSFDEIAKVNNCISLVAYNEMFNVLNDIRSIDRKGVVANLNRCEHLISKD